MFLKKIFILLSIALFSLSFLTLFNAVSLGAEQSIALIYNGKAASRGGPEAIASVVQSLGMRVVYFDNPQKLPALLDSAKICVFGGTDDNLTPLIEQLTPEVRESLINWIKTGGRYVGICGGAYIASKGWEEAHFTVKTLGLVPLMSAAWIEQTPSRIITITWAGKNRPIYYQYGPAFIENESVHIEVLSRYNNGKVAALAYKLGEGVIVLFGPHPEADGTWLIDTPTPLNAENWKSTRDIADDIFINPYF